MPVNTGGNHFGQHSFMLVNTGDYFGGNFFGGSLPVRRYKSKPPVSGATALVNGGMGGTGYLRLVRVEECGHPAALLCRLLDAPPRRLRRYLKVDRDKGCLVG
jgi:hypothetical protein